MQAQEENQPEEDFEYKELSQEEIEQAVYSNKMKLFGKEYPLFTMKDILDKEAGGCVYCLLHNDGTPCGEQLLEWKECTLKNSERKELGYSTNEECNHLFQEKFFPCFAKYAQTDYYKLRADFVVQSKSKDLMKLYMKVQKKQLRDKIKGFI